MSSVRASLPLAVALMAALDGATAAQEQRERVAPAEAASDTDLPVSERARPVMGQTPRPTPGPDLARPPKDAAERRVWLRERLDGLFKAPWLDKARVSVLVVESDSGRPVYALGEKTQLNAASNVKVVTAAAALALLGPEYRWRTLAYGPGQRPAPILEPGGELAGDLMIRGLGDPTLTAQDLGAMVNDLWGLGLRKVRGGIVVDESFFGPEHVGPAFDQKSESAAFRAPSSAASLGGNVVAVTVIPAAQPGASARILIEPSSPYFTTAGRVTTASSGPAAPAVETADDGKGHTRILLGGRVRLGSEPRTFLRRVVHPQLFLGHTLRQLLVRRGIAADRPVRTGAVPPDGVRVLSSHESPPLGVVVHELDKRSNNFVAEQLVRTIGAEMGGRPGTWDKGIAAISRWLESVGLARGSYRMTNGSGLYDSNHFSAEQLVSVIRGAMRDFRIASEFLASLAVAGTDGTIGHRMGGGLAERYVRAKTGTLAGVSCLSGIAGSPGHTPLVFSILMNDVPNPIEARKTQDRAAELLVAYLEAK